MSSYIIDTNVLIVTNGNLSGGANLVCQLTCVNKMNECAEILRGKHKGKKIILDHSDIIFDQYQKHMNFAGTPGLGDMFFKLLHEKQASELVCEKVSVTHHSKRCFEEFPGDPDLEKFDKDDRVFVAVSIAYEKKNKSRPTILNATDSDWHDFELPLKKYVKVKQLCPDCIKSSKSST